jgi:hypothetical protein
MGLGFDPWARARGARTILEVGIRYIQLGTLDGMNASVIQAALQYCNPRDLVRQ